MALRLTQQEFDLLDPTGERINSQFSIAPPASPILSPPKPQNDNFIKSVTWRPKSLRHLKGEIEEQAGLIAMARGSSHEGISRLFSISNEATYNNKKLQAAGVLPGIPDLFMPWPLGDRAGLFIEMKTRGGQLRPGQAEMLEWLHSVQFAVAVCWGADAGWAAIENYLLTNG